MATSKENTHFWKISRILGIKWALEVVNSNIPIVWMRKQNLAWCEIRDLPGTCRLGKLWLKASQPGRLAELVGTQVLSAHSSCIVYILNLRKVYAHVILVHLLKMTSLLTIHGKHSAHWTFRDLKHIFFSWRFCAVVSLCISRSTFQSLLIFWSVFCSKWSQNELTWHK